MSLIKLTISHHTRPPIEVDYKDSHNSQLDMVHKQACRVVHISCNCTIVIDRQLCNYSESSAGGFLGHQSYWSSLAGTSPPVSIPNPLCSCHLPFQSTPWSGSKLFGSGIWLRKTLWGNKWFDCNNLFAKKVIVQRGKWLSTPSSKQHCHCLDPMVLYYILCLMWEQKPICTGLDGWFTIHKFLECCLFANTKNVWSCITSCEGMNKQQLGTQVTTQNLFNLTDVVH